jgi:hypothetical protein
MSDKKNNNRPFTNEDTLVRRAWVESALESVRGRIKAANPDIDDSVANVGADQSLQSAFQATDDVVEATDSQSGRKPQLYVAWSSPARRSGT